MFTITLPRDAERHRASINLGRFIHRVVAAIGREYRIRRDFRFLMEQDERMLKDLGITRSDVQRLVRGR